MSGYTFSSQQKADCIQHALSEKRIGDLLDEPRTSNDGLEWAKLSGMVIVLRQGLLGWPRQVHRLNDGRIVKDVLYSDNLFEGNEWKDVTNLDKKNYARVT